MAEQVIITGWLNEIKQFQWGHALTVSVPVRQKNASTGEWETVSRNYWDVAVPDHVDLGDVRQDEQVVITGSFKKGKSFQRKDGSWDVELKCRATSVALYDREALQTAPQDGPVSFDDAPF